MPICFLEAAAAVWLCWWWRRKHVTLRKDAGGIVCLRVLRDLTDLVHMPVKKWTDVACLRGRVKGDEHAWLAEPPAFGSHKTAMPKAF